MCIDHLPEDFCQPIGILLSEADGHGYVVLCRIAVQFPVDIDATLVLGQRVAVLLTMEGREVDVCIYLRAECRLCHIPYRRMLQQLAHGNL